MTPDVIGLFCFCVAGFIITSVFSVRTFIEVKISNEKYTYINEIFKQYFEIEDDNHDAT